RTTVTLFGILVANPRHLSQAFFRFQDKAFRKSDLVPVREELRDAQNYALGLTHFVRFEEDRHYLKLGYQFDRDDTVGRNYTYVGHRIVAGGQYTLPWQSLRLRYDLDVHTRVY